MTKEAQKVGLQDITPAMVRSVYAGRAEACCCGCAGKHRYNPDHVAQASKHRGYAVEGNEVSAPEVLRVLRLVQSVGDGGLDEGNDPGDEHVSATVGRKQYVVYLADGFAFAGVVR